MTPAIDRLRALLAEPTPDQDEASVQLGRVVVPPHIKVIEGRPVRVKGYTYTRRGGKRFKIARPAVRRRKAQAKAVAARQAPQPVLERAGNVESPAISIFPVDSIEEAQGVVEGAKAYLANLAYQQPDELLDTLTKPGSVEYLKQRRKILLTTNDLNVPKGQKISVSRERGRIETILRATHLNNRIKKGTITVPDAQEELAYLRTRMSADPTNDKKGTPKYLKVFGPDYPLDVVGIVEELTARVEQYSTPSTSDDEPGELNLDTMEYEPGTAQPETYTVGTIAVVINPDGSGQIPLPGGEKVYAFEPGATVTAKGDTVGVYDPSGSIQYVVGGFGNEPPEEVVDADDEGWQAITYGEGFEPPLPEPLPGVQSAKTPLLEQNAVDFAEKMKDKGLTGVNLHVAGSTGSEGPDAPTKFAVSWVVHGAYMARLFTEDKPVGMTVGEPDAKHIAVGWGKYTSPVAPTSKPAPEQFKAAAQAVFDLHAATGATVSLYSAEGHNQAGDNPVKFGVKIEHPDGKVQSKWWGPAFPQGSQWSSSDFSSWKLEASSGPLQKPPGTATTAQISALKKAIDATASYVVGTEEIGQWHYDMPSPEVTLGLVYDALGAPDKVGVTTPNPTSWVLGTENNAGKSQTVYIRRSNGHISVRTWASTEERIAWEKNYVWTPNPAEAIAAAGLLAFKKEMDAESEVAKPKTAAEIIAELGFDPDTAPKTTLMSWIKDKGGAYVGAMTKEQNAEWVKYHSGLASFDDSLDKKWGPGTHDEQIVHLEAWAKNKTLVSKIKALAIKAQKEQEATDAAPHPLVASVTAAAPAYIAKVPSFEAAQAELATFPWYGSVKQKNAWIKQRGGNYLAQMSSSDKLGWARMHVIGDELGKYRLEALSAEKPGWTHKLATTHPGSPHSLAGKAAIQAQADFLISRPYGSYLFDADGVWKATPWLTFSSGPMGMPQDMVEMLVADMGLAGQATPHMTHQFDADGKLTGYQQRRLALAWAAHRPKDLTPTPGLVQALHANPITVKVAKPEGVSDEAWELSGFLDAIPDDVNPFASLAPDIDEMTEGQVDAALTSMPFVTNDAAAGAWTVEQVLAAPLNVKKGLLYAIDGGDPELPDPPYGLASTIAAKIKAGKYTPQYSVEGPASVEVNVPLVPPTTPGGDYDLGGHKVYIPAGAQAFTMPSTTGETLYGFRTFKDGEWKVTQVWKDGVLFDFTMTPQEMQEHDEKHVKSFLTPKPWVTEVTPEPEAQFSPVVVAGLQLDEGDVAYVSISNAQPEGVIQFKEGSKAYTANVTNQVPYAVIPGSEQEKSLDKGLLSGGTAWTAQVGSPGVYTVHAFVPGHGLRTGQIEVGKGAHIRVNAQGEALIVEAEDDATGNDLFKVTLKALSGKAVLEKEAVEDFSQWDLAATEFSHFTVKPVTTAPAAAPPITVDTVYDVGGSLVTVKLGHTAWTHPEKPNTGVVLDAQGNLISTFGDEISAFKTWAPEKAEVIKDYWTKVEPAYTGPAEEVTFPSLGKGAITVTLVPGDTVISDGFAVIVIHADGSGEKHFGDGLDPKEYGHDLLPLEHFLSNGWQVKHMGAIAAHNAAQGPAPAKKVTWDDWTGSKTAIYKDKWAWLEGLEQGAPSPSLTSLAVNFWTSNPDSQALLQTYVDAGESPPGMLDAPVMVKQMVLYHHVMGSSMGTVVAMAKFKAEKGHYGPGPAPKVKTEVTWDAWLAAGGAATDATIWQQIEEIEGGKDLPPSVVTWWEENDGPTAIVAAVNEGFLGAEILDAPLPLQKLAYYGHTPPTTAKAYSKEAYELGLKIVLFKAAGGHYGKEPTSVQVLPPTPVTKADYEAVKGPIGTALWSWLEAVEDAEFNALSYSIKNAHSPGVLDALINDGTAHANLAHAPKGVQAAFLWANFENPVTGQGTKDLINFKAEHGHYGGAKVPVAAATSGGALVGDFQHHIAQGQTSPEAIYAHWPPEAIQAYATANNLTLQAAAWDQGAANEVAAHLAGTHPTQTPEPPQPVEIPDTAPVLTPIKAKSAKGAHPKHFWKDQNGEEYMSKPHSSDSSARQYRAEVEDAANRIGKLFGFNSATTYAMELQGQAPGWHFVQHLRDLDSSQPDFEKGSGGSVMPSELTDDQLIDALSEHVLDWVVSNHDTHDANLMFQADGTVFGIDKGQAYKFFGTDKLAVGYRPQGNPDPVWYDLFYKQVQNGSIDKERLDKVTLAVLARAKKVQLTKDEEFRAQVEYGVKHYPLKQIKGLGFPSRKAFIDAIVERKQQTWVDFEKFYAELYTAGGYGELPKPEVHAEVSQTFTLTKSDGTKVQRTRRFFSGISPQALEAVAASKAYGVPLFFRGTDIEDIHAQVFESKTGAQRNLHAHLKLRKDADARATKWIKSHDIEAKAGAIPSQTTAPADLSLVLFKKDEWHNAIVQAAKTVSHHTVADANSPSGFTLDAEGYNASTMAALAAAKDEIDAALGAVQQWANNPGIKKPYTSTASNKPSFQTLSQQEVWMAMATQYLDDIAAIEEAVAEVKKAPKVAEWTAVPKPQAPVETTYTNAEGLKLDVLTDGTGVLYTPEKPGESLFTQADIVAAIKDHGLTEGEESSLGTLGSQEIKLYKKNASGASGSLDLDTGELELGQAQSSGYTGQMYEIHIGDDVVIEYQPWNGEGVQLSQQGQLKITVNNHDGSPDHLQSAFDLLKKMGVDTAPADEIDMETFYWRHLANIPADRKGVPAKVNKAVTAVNSIPDGLSREEYLAELRKAWMLYLGGQRVSEVAEQGKYMPRFLKSAAGEAQPGRPVWVRPDYTAAELVAMMGNYPWITHHVTAHGSLIPGEPQSSSARPNWRALNMALSGGLLSTEERLRLYGQYMAGMSSSSDQGTGGAAYVFTRLNQSPSSSSPTVLANPFSLLRTSTFSFNSDQFGRVKNRASMSPYKLEDSTKFGTSGYSSSNETVPKFGLTWGEDVEFISFSQAKYRDEAIKRLKAQGITHIRGLPIEQRLIMANDTSAALKALKDRMKELIEQFDIGDDE